MNKCETNNWNKLSLIVAKDWILKTTEKMKNNNKEDTSSWNFYWEETYSELGGKKESVAHKGCPKKAGYTLWYLGRIKNTGRERIEMDITDILDEISKNGAYAILGQEILYENPELNKSSLFRIIQEEFKKRTKEEPAKSNQGGPTLTWILFKEGLLQ